MKKIIAFLIVFSIISSFFVLSADEDITNSVDKERAFGFELMAGGRYDNMRMCVASPAGTNGGPVADIKLLMKFRMSLDWSMIVTIPVFRPVLFGAAFKTLQYESDVAMEYKVKLTEKTDFVTGPGIGMSYNYGKGVEREDKFFSLGPMVSYYAAFDFKAPKSYATRFGIQLFHVSLFKTVKDFSSDDYGMVFGGALNFGMYF